MNDTSRTLAVQGAMAMGTSAVVGGVLLALIEGVGVMLNRWQSSMFDPSSWCRS